MSDFEVVKKKLADFTRKYYINELIKGTILFFAIGVLYFLITLLIEYYLWLGSMGRTILFWLFIVVETALFSKFIMIPIFKLFRLSSRISNEKASKMIGTHFADVDDKLLNLLQLSENNAASALLLASIEQKSNQLKPIPFSLAINLSKNSKYLKYAAIPILLFFGISVIGDKGWLTESYGRVVNYETAYQPPAPFQFLIMNENLRALENTDFVLNVRTQGKILPETATINYNGETYFLKNMGLGEFQYVFTQPKEALDFVIVANEINSQKYVLDVVPVPVLLDFSMELDFPSYTNKKAEVLQSTGNAIIPEGTKVTWKVKTRNTDNVSIRLRDSLIKLEKRTTDFFLEQRLYNNWEYELSTSNKNIVDYDNLAFSINVVKDQYPEINLTSKKDSIDQNTLYFFGRVSDDYGLSKLRIVYYDSRSDIDKMVKNLTVTSGTFDEFTYSFPNDLVLEPGISYDFYFEIFDNDAIHKYKSSKSQTFNFRKLTMNEEEDKRLEQQNEAITGLNKSLEKFKEQQSELKEISKLQKEKKQLDYNDKKKLEEFLKKQKEQEKLMKDFSKKLKDNLDAVEEKKKEEPFKDALKEMMERNEERLKKNEKLLKELEKLSEKIHKEELSEKLEELAKENKNVKKNLEQLLELTKRYYVIEKHEKLGDKLKEMSEEQKALSEKKPEENTKEKQDELNKDFQDFQKEMDELRKQNEDLKKPMNLDQDKSEEEKVKEEQEKASDNLEKEDKEEAKKNQKSAAEKMKKMQQGMQMSMQSGGEAQQEEDTKMLRQILDNLVDFSLGQEGLMTEFKGISIDDPGYSGKLRAQSVLRENFLHVDDSLYALALRTPKISDIITGKLTDIQYNIDKSLERLADNKIVQGAANQQYTVTESNELAYMLSKSLDQMQNSMPQSGSGKKGKSQGFQLPDIIKKQEELNGKMKNGTKKGDEAGKEKGDKEGGQKPGEEGKDGKEGKGGEKGKDGEKGKSGVKGEGKDEGEQKGEGGNENGERKSEMQKEEMSGELFEIYKQQQQLRNALQDKIDKSGAKGSAESNLMRTMEQVEQELLEKGFNENTLSKMLELKHQLLKMENATIEQGEDEKRKSKTNKKTFENTTNSSERIKQYFNTTEILNRQVLPLQQNYKRKVQEYFKNSND